MHDAHRQSAPPHWAVRCPKCLRTRPLRDAARLTPESEGRRTAARCGRCGIVFAEIVRLASVNPRTPDVSLADAPAEPGAPLPGHRRAAG